jgi:two-component system LytT family response regulator
LLLGQRLDGVFLDLEMPGGHGMTFLPEIRAMRVPVVVTTAHEHFALDAFDADVADYLLKPIEGSRLIRALARLRQPAPQPEDKLIVLGDQTHCWPLQPEEIIMVESEGSYVMIHVKDRKPILLTRSLREIEHLLPESQFVRVNRSQIARLHCLQQIRRKDGGGFTAHVEGIGSIEFSRRQAQAFRQRHRL